MEALAVMPAVSLAKAVLDSVLGWAIPAMADRVALVQRVSKDVRSIHDELKMMHAFLRASSPAYPNVGGGDEVQTEWVKQLRDLALDIEDGLIDFMLIHGPADLAARFRVAEQIKDLKERVEGLHNLNRRYQVFAGADRSSRHRDNDHDEPAFLDEWCHQDIIGRDGDKKALAKLVGKTEKRNSVAVVAVWGMAGVGKSSLVRMLYDDADFISRFDHRAWVTVPHPLESAQEFGRLLVEQLGVDGEKRCLVVVDDVSSDVEWLHIWSYLTANGTGSGLVVVTTREGDVAGQCGREGAVYELEPLPHEEAQKLLCLKVYKDSKYKLASDMVKQSNLILGLCRGFPLAIVSIGGLLANRPKTITEWMSLQEHLSSMSEFDLRIKRSISLNYDRLPYYVKLCFLYMCIFPENHVIKQTRLLRRWMAEGYIEKQSNKTLEEVGQSHYNKFVNRSMIDPSIEATTSMTSECCRVHGLVLQTILPKSIEENQLFIMDKHRNKAPQSNIRHLVVTGRKRCEKMPDINLCLIRSLTVFGECPMSLITPELRLLRVLDLEGTIGLEDDDLKDIGKLPHLKYIGLRGTNISKLPSSLQKLRFLETLDVKDTKVTQLPDGLIYLEKLCYLRGGGVNFASEEIGEEKNVGKRNGNFLRTLAGLVCCHGGYNEICESGCADQFSIIAPKKTEKPSNLQVLGVVHIARSQDARKLRMLPNLRKLGVHLDAADEVGQELCSSIERIVRLERLEVRCESLRFLEGMKEPPLRHLLSLRLYGYLGGLPGWMSSLGNLSKIKLMWTRLKHEDMVVIGSLPKVVLLALWEESFVDESLSFGDGTFQKLKFLDIEGLGKVKTISIQNGAFPALEKLRVRKCLELYNSKKGLSGVKSLQKLIELDLTSCGDKPRLEMALRKQTKRLSNQPTFITGKARIRRRQMILNRLHTLVGRE